MVVNSRPLTWYSVSGSQATISCGKPRRYSSTTGSASRASDGQKSRPRRAKPPSVIASTITLTSPVWSRWRWLSRIAFSRAGRPCAWRTARSRPGPGSRADPRVAVLEVEAARGRELLGDHEPGAGGAHERELHRGGCLRNLGRGSFRFVLRRKSARKAPRRGPGCRSRGPACRRGCGRSAGSAARSRFGAAAERWIESKATSSTISGLHHRDADPGRSTCARGILGHLRDLGIGEPGVGLADVDQPVALPRRGPRRCSRRAPLAACRDPSTAVTTTSSVASGRFSLSQPAPAAGRVRAQRVFHHQALVAPLAGLGEDPVEVLGVLVRRLEPRKQEGRLQASSSNGRRASEGSSSSARPSSHTRSKTTSTTGTSPRSSSRPTLRPSRRCSSKKRSTRPVAMRQGPRRRRARRAPIAGALLDQLRESRRGFLQVSREKLHAVTPPVQLAAHAVVFLLQSRRLPAPMRSKASVAVSTGLASMKRIGWKSVIGLLELAVLGADGRLADVAGDQVDPLDRRDAATSKASAIAASTRPSLRPIRISPAMILTTNRPRRRRAGEQSLERSLLAGAGRPGSRRASGDLGQRAGPGSPSSASPGPVAEVRCLREDSAGLVVAAPVTARHRPSISDDQPRPAYASAKGRRPDRS